MQLDACVATKPFGCSPKVSGHFWCFSLLVYFQESSWQDLWMTIKYSV